MTQTNMTQLSKFESYPNTNMTRPSKSPPYLSVLPPLDPNPYIPNGYEPPPPQDPNWISPIAPLSLDARTQEFLDSRRPRVGTVAERRAMAVLRQNELANAVVQVRLRAYRELERAYSLSVDLDDIWVDMRLSQAEPADVPRPMWVPFQTGTNTIGLHAAYKHHAARLGAWVLQRELQMMADYDRRAQQILNSGRVVCEHDVESWNSGEDDPSNPMPRFQDTPWMVSSSVQEPY
ncbi:hypothetical protein QBC34DRAFT_164183 [Podospora aff. communis PSN243]|uniref:Uncharacterized protein n=1 Tax=Podospora aff. communis PSN243 TaxID=3040156 RepID=A0AAV9GE45_9PEZI|nr:hypothetical protein QBC34DRAFT_164183 [Podospora aff. communis PSN243]